MAYYGQKNDLMPNERSLLSRHSSYLNGIGPLTLSQYDEGVKQRCGIRYVSEKSPKMWRQ